MLQLCLQDLEPGEADVKSAKPSAFVHRPILDQVHFDKLVDSKWVTEGRQAPLFVPPAAFSRMDQPQEYQVWPVIQYFNCIFSGGLCKDLLVRSRRFSSFCLLVISEGHSEWNIQPFLTQLRESGE